MRCSAGRILCAGGDLHPPLEREMLCLAENRSHVLLLQPTRLQVKEKYTLEKILQHAGSMQQVCFTVCWSTRLALHVGCRLEGVLPLSYRTMRSFCCICVGADIYLVVWSPGAGTMPLQINNFPFFFIHLFSGFIFIWISSLLVGLDFINQPRLGSTEDGHPLQTGLKWKRDHQGVTKPWMSW